MECGSAVPIIAPFAWVEEDGLPLILVGFVCSCNRFPARFIAGLNSGPDRPKEFRRTGQLMAAVKARRKGSAQQAVAAESAPTAARFVPYIPPVRLPAMDCISPCDFYTPPTG